MDPEDYHCFDGLCVSKQMLKEQAAKEGGEPSKVLESLTSRFSEGVGAALKSLKENAKEVVDGAKEVVDGAKDAAKDAAQAVVDGAKALVEGHTKMEDGIQYKILKQGDGRLPVKGETAIVHYTGKLEDGTVFDSSVERNEPFTFPVGGGRVIQGWDTTIALMKVGEKRSVYIPPELAYGAQERGKIPANSTLHFEMELLGLQSIKTGEGWSCDDKACTPMKPMDIMNKMKETVEDAGKKVKETVEDAGKKVKETVEDAGKKVKETAEKVGEQVKETAEKVGEQVKETAEKGAEMPEEMKKQMMEQMMKMMQQQAKEEAKEPLERLTKIDYEMKPSGLGYKIEAPGNGKAPKDGDEVDIIIGVYTAGGNALVHGRELTELKLGDDTKIPLKAVWEALKMLKPGGKGQFLIPPELGYGDDADGEMVKKGENLYMELENRTGLPKKEKPAEEAPAKEKPTEEAPAKDKAAAADAAIDKAAEA